MLTALLSGSRGTQPEPQDPKPQAAPFQAGGWQLSIPAHVTLVTPPNCSGHPGMSRARPFPAADLLAVSTGWHRYIPRLVPAHPQVGTSPAEGAGPRARCSPSGGARSCGQRDPRAPPSGNETRVCAHGHTQHSLPRPARSRRLPRPPGSARPRRTRVFVAAPQPPPGPAEHRATAANWELRARERTREPPAGGQRHTSHPRGDSVTSARPRTPVPRAGPARAGSMFCPGAAGHLSSCGRSC